MNILTKTWFKPLSTLLVLSILTWFAPSQPVDPWRLLSPQKVLTMILALVIIQIFGSVFAHILGSKMGALLTGFLGGIISSTATTASLAKRSQMNVDQNDSDETLTFLAATSAMLIEGFLLVVAGSSKAPLATLIIFIGPLMASLVLIVIQLKNTSQQNNNTQNTLFKILPILKLSLFIIFILSLSKIFQNLFGQKGLLVITGLVSLFEIHGSVIANVQLHDQSFVSNKMLCSLLAISIIASYLSKLFLIYFLGSKPLLKQAAKSTVFLFVSVGFSWVLSQNFL